jgi:hypothetical protein
MENTRELYSAPANTNKPSWSLDKQDTEIADAGNHRNVRVKHTEPSSHQGQNSPLIPTFAAPNLPTDSWDDLYASLHNTIRPLSSDSHPTFQFASSLMLKSKKPPSTHQFQRPQSFSPDSSDLQEIQRQFDIHQHEAVPEYPNAVALLEQINRTPPRVAQLTKLPVYDYIYEDEQPICFTAVELITFLPRLCRSRWVAERLLNGGMSNVAHLEIHKTHRFTAKHRDGFTRNTVAFGYTDAMRGPGWRLKDTDPQGAWSRKTHKVPEGWQCTSAMNKFAPDGLLKGNWIQPEPVPFSDLLKGVKKIPVGSDAADLTRAIDFAVGNVKETGQIWMFPTDLKTILDHIGRTVLTSEHQDRAINQRYQFQKRESERRKKVSHWLDTSKETGDTTSVTLPQPTQSEQLNALSTPVPTGDLIRDSPFWDGMPPHMRRIILFAGRPDQSNIDWRWNDRHVEEICASFNEEDVKQSQQFIQASQEHNPEYMELVDEQAQTDSYDPIYCHPTIPVADSVLTSISMTESDHKDLLGSSESSPFSYSNMDMTIFQEAPMPSAYLEVTQEEMRGHAPTDLLRDCIEGQDRTDHSRLAQAARIARQHPYIVEDWCVQNIPLLLVTEFSDNVLNGEYE